DLASVRVVAAVFRIAFGRAPPRLGHASRANRIPKKQRSGASAAGRLDFALHAFGPMAGTFGLNHKEVFFVREVRDASDTLPFVVVNADLRADVASIMHFFAPDLPAR